MNRTCGFMLCLLLVSTTAAGQSLRKPKAIKAKGDYTHIHTGAIFPVSVGDFSRKTLEAFDKKKEDVAASYEYACPGKGKTKITVYIYPAGAATSNRLRDEFLSTVVFISLNAGKKLQYGYTYCPYTEGPYKVNGFRSSFIPDNDKINWLELYECGKWFLKIRTTSQCLDTPTIKAVNREFAETFNPAKILQSSPLRLNPHSIISDKAFFDKAFLGCIYFRAKAEMIWATDNVDSMEKIAGFPGLYMDMYLAGIKGLLYFADTTTVEAGSTAKELIETYRSLDKNNFLDEFIMEQKSGVVIVPDHHVFDFAGYKKWKTEHPLKEYMNSRFYENEYEQHK